MNVDTDLFNTFLEITRTKHFGKAADNLYITQSTVSARIKLLETKIGAPLFTRNKNDIQLTSSGKRLVSYAESIVNTWNRAQQEIAIDSDNIVPVSIGSLPSLWDIILEDWLITSYQRHPDFLIDLEILAYDSISRRLLEGSLDIGFTYEPLHDSTLDSRQVYEVNLIMVSTYQNISLNEAFTKNYIYVDWGTSFAIAHAKLFPNMNTPILRTGLGRVAQNFLLKNSGTCYLAASMVEELIQNNTLYPVAAAPVIKRHAFAVFPINSSRLNDIDLLLEFFNNK